MGQNLERERQKGIASSPSVKEFLLFLLVVKARVDLSMREEPTFHLSPNLQYSPSSLSFIFVFLCNICVRFVQWSKAYIL